MILICAEQCIKFKTYSSIFLNRFEALNLSLMQKMQNRRPSEPESTPMQVDVAASTSNPASTTAPSAQGTPSGGVKKKPKKKKK
jgi:signal recognition particle subunit SRP9